MLNEFLFILDQLWKMNEKGQLENKKASATKRTWVYQEKVWEMPEAGEVGYITFARDIRLTPDEKMKIILSPTSPSYSQKWKILLSNHDEYFALFNVGQNKVLTFENETSAKLSGIF